MKTKIQYWLQKEDINLNVLCEEIEKRKALPSIIEKHNSLVDIPKNAYNAEQFLIDTGRTRHKETEVNHLRELSEVGLPLRV